MRLKKKATADKKRKSYEPPRIEEEGKFETVALSCGKASGFGCQSGGGLQS